MPSPWGALFSDVGDKLFGLRDERINERNQALVRAIQDRQFNQQLTQQRELSEAQLAAQQRQQDDTRDTRRIEFLAQNVAPGTQLDPNDPTTQLLMQDYSPLVQQGTEAGPITDFGQRGPEGSGFMGVGRGVSLPEAPAGQEVTRFRGVEPASVRNAQTRANMDMLKLQVQQSTQNERLALDKAKLQLEQLKSVALTNYRGEQLQMMQRQLDTAEQRLGLEYSRLDQQWQLAQYAQSVDMYIAGLNNFNNNYRAELNNLAGPGSNLMDQLLSQSLGFEMPEPQEQPQAQNPMQPPTPPTPPARGGGGGQQPAMDLSGLSPAMRRLVEGLMAGTGGGR